MHTLLLNRSNTCLLQEIYEVYCDEDSFSTAYLPRLDYLILMIHFRRILLPSIIIEMV